MSLGANFSSGYTDKIQQDEVRCAVPRVSLESCIPCKTDVSGPQPIAQTCSMALLGKSCPPPTEAEFALYPKVAVASSVRTLAIIDKVLDKSQRFSQYRRYTPPTPCPPLPPTMAGISQPSSKRC
jgi:hypothetical protein